MKKVIIFAQSREKLKIVIRKKLNGNKNLILIFFFKGIYIPLTKV